MVFQNLQFGNFTLDVDSTVHTRYGNQQGANIPIRPKATGRSLKLFEQEGIYRQYRYGSFITSLDLPPEQIWTLYRQRADAEHRIKELKYRVYLSNAVMHMAEKVAEMESYRDDDAFKSMVAKLSEAIHKEKLIQLKTNQFTKQTFGLVIFGYGKNRTYWDCS